MILNQKQIDEVMELAKPLVKWLNENGNPYSKIVVNTYNVECFDGVFTQEVTEFIKD